MFGRSARLEIEHLIGIPIEDDDDTNHHDDENNKGDYAHRLIKRLQTALSYVKTNHKKAIEYRSKHYLNDDAADFQVGKIVWFFTPKRISGSSPKLMSGWSKHPFKIIKRITPILYEIESLRWSVNKIRLVTSLTRIKLYKREYNDSSDNATRTDIEDYNPSVFHEYDTFTDDDDVDTSPKLTLEDLSKDSFRLQSGDWILKEKKNSDVTQA